MERINPIPKQPPTSKEEQTFKRESNQYGGTERERWSDYTKPDSGNRPYYDKGGHQERSNANRDLPDNWGYD